MRVARPIGDRHVSATDIPQQWGASEANCLSSNAQLALGPFQAPTRPGTGNAQNEHMLSGKRRTP